MDLKYKIKWFLIRHSLFKHTFRSIEGFVHINRYNEPTHEITDTVRWLGAVDVHCRYKDADKKAIEAFNELYPQYKGYVCIF